MSGPVWMKFYVGDYLGDTMHLTCGQHGAYLLLILAYWRNGGPLPDDNTQLAAIAKCSPAEWQKILPVIRAFFRVENGLWIHKRINAELEGSARKGKGAAAKWSGQDEDRRMRSQSRSAAQTRSQRLSAAREKATHTPEEWTALLEIFGNACVRCGAHGLIVKDHITPIYQGGSDGIENIQPLCKSCNSSKGPENIDYRENACPDWKKRLQNACKMPVTSSRATDSETETEEEPPLKAPPTGGQNNGAAINDRNGRGQGTRLPVDWQPDAADREFAGELGLDAGQVAEQFRDYWQAVPGRKATKLDWHATFRNACRHYATTGAGRSGNGSGRGTHRPATAGFTAAIRRAFADADDENLG